MASIFLLLLIGLLISPSLHFSVGQPVGTVGVCYGKLGNNLPTEPEVVELYRSKGIGKMRIYWPDIPTLEALRGSNIELIVDVPRENLQALADPAAAAEWVQDHVVAYSPDVKFRYISVGNEIRPGAAEAPYILPAMRNVQAAISAANLRPQVKVSTTIDTTLITNSFPPSAGVFTAAAEGYIAPIVRFLAENGSPLLANIYPYFSYVGERDSAHPIDINYALFRSEHGVVAPDGARYGNLFDAQLDAVYAALEKAGAAGVAVVVAETGWPSWGDRDATVENAAVYHRNLIEHVRRGSGTLKRREGPIEAYLFAMFDENQKTGQAVEQHFGLFSPNKQPKYQLHFN